MISRLQYISQRTDEKTIIENIKEACIAGVDWVELKAENFVGDEFEALAFEVKDICRKHGAHLIIDGNAEVAKAVKANGLFLNQEDIDPVEARALLGDKPYIGGAANTWEEVELLYDLKVVDYIGLGPFKFSESSTKPGIGITGYSNILNNMIIQNIDIPIFAKGGVGLEDIFDLQLTGCYGVAINSLINESFDKKETIEEIKLLLPEDANFDQPKDSLDEDEDQFEY